MAPEQETYLRVNILGHPLIVTGSGQDQSGADRVDAPIYNLPDGRTLPNGDTRITVPPEMTTTQTVQIKYDVPADAGDDYTRVEQYLRGLSLILAHKGYSAMWNQQMNGTEGITLVLSVSPRPDMGNTRDHLVVRQDEIALDIRDGLDYLGKTYRNGTVDFQRLSDTLEKSRDDDAAKVTRSFPAFRKKLREVAAEYRIKDRRGMTASRNLIEQLVQSQYPGAELEQGMAAVSPQGSHVDASMRKNSVMQLIDSFTKELNVRGVKEDALDIRSLQEALAEGIQQFSPAIIGLGPAR